MMTNEQKKEIVRKYINPETDFEVTDKGMYLLTAEASKRIAESFNLHISEGGRFEPKAIVDFILRKEGAKIAANASVQRAREQKASERNASVKKIKESIMEAIGKGYNNYEIANYLNLVCGTTAKSIIFEAIEEVASEGVELNADEVKKCYEISLTCKAVTMRFANAHATKNKQELKQAVAQDIVNYYKKGLLKLGHLYGTMRDAGFETDLIEAIKSEFYRQYEGIFAEKYGNTELSLEALVDEICEKYINEDIFDSRVILTYISKLDNLSFDIDEVAYQLYKKEGDAKLVYNVLTLKGLTAKEYAQKLKDLDILYPPSCIKRTMDVMRQGCPGIPYDEIFAYYCDTQEELEEDVELATREESVAVLVDEEFVEPSKVADEDDTISLDAEEELEEVLEEPVVETHEPRRLRIEKKEQEIKKSERKKTLAILLIASGMIPVMVLAWVFKVDPVVAAKNISSSLGQLTSGTIGLKDILPTAGQLATLLAGAATSFTGLIKAHKHKKKITELREEISDLEENEELDDDIENTEELTATPKKKGRG